MVFGEQDVVASHNTSSQTGQQKVCECPLSVSAHAIFTGVLMVSGKLPKGTFRTRNIHLAQHLRPRREAFPSV